MAPIALPPELPLSQPLEFSRSAADLQIPEQGAASILTHHYPGSYQALEDLSQPSFSPKSLIPPEQFSSPSSVDLSSPDLAQLPSLPPSGSSIPANSAFDDEVLDAVEDLSEENAVEIIEGSDSGNLGEDVLQNRDLLDADMTDLEGVKSDDINSDVIGDVVNSDDLPDEFITEDLELEETSDALENPLDSIAPGAMSNDTNIIPDGPDSSSSVETVTPLDPSKLEITADTQIFDSNRQVVNARGNVVFKLNNAFLLADELWVNLVNRYVLAEGNVILTRGEQEVRAERAEYNLLQEDGTLFETRGELFLPELEDDFAAPIEGTLTSRSVFDPLNPDREITNVTRSGGFEVSSQIRGSTPGSFPEGQGGVRRLRFEAARVQFDAETWVAEDVRLTNDPFSPPELEYRTARMTLATLSPTADLLTTEDPRLVFDQRLSLPLFKSRYVINRGDVDPNQVNPFPINIGSDSRDRGGVFLESEFSLVRNESTNLSITPQYFLQRALEQGTLEPDAFGVELDFSRRLNSRSNISVGATVTSLDLDEIEENVRGNIRHRLLVGTHLLATEYSYRDRLFNGSLGFQTVRSSLGTVLLSPVINLDNRGLNLTYQVGGQWITADTDRLNLLDPLPRDNNRISLGRFQGVTRLSKGFSLWRGKPLPATKTEGLRYSPIPLVPFLSVSLGLQGVGSYYTSGDFQSILAGDIRFDGQFGHLSDDFFDYTRFNLGYYHAFLASENSPFLFDRNVDTKVLTFGAVQQIIGPILLGFQTSINLETNERVNTEIIGEYSRRTYGLVVRYSPTQSTGSIGFRLSDFNWLGSGSPFDNPNIRQVEGGVIEQKR